jgi:putative phage-type endonuclease
MENLLVSLSLQWEMKLMKILNLEQGSPEWLSWRKTVITATDCPIIMGSSPWSTEYQCWQRKLGLVEEQKSNEAMERGKRLEPEARAHFMEKYGINMTPVVVESSEFEFLGASLDGLSDCKKYILEIKCGGSKLYDMALQGIIPPYYDHQVQQQLLVTGAERCFYYCYNGKDAVCIEVLPDKDFLSKYLPKARAFWKCIALEESPALQDSDYVDMSSEKRWGLLASEYMKICEQIKTLDSLKESYRKELISLCRNQSSKGSGIKVIKTTMKGRVAYDEIPEIQMLDLEKYRKSAIVSWKILL